MAIWLQILLGAVAFAAVLGLLKAWFDRPPHVRELILASVFLIGFGAALYGFLDHPVQCKQGPSVGLQGFFDALHRGFQLLVLNVDADSTQGPWLSIARVLLPLVAAQVAMLIIWQRIGQWLLRLRLRFSCSGPEVLVLGCGETGLRIARHHVNDTSRIPVRLPKKQRRRVVGVDKAPTGPGALEFRARGFDVLAAELESDEALASMELARRSLIVIATGNDVLDLNLATRVITRLSAEGQTTTRVVISVDSLTVPRACRFDPTLAPWYQDSRLEFVNVAHGAARLLFLEYPPHRIAHRRFGVSVANPCHIAICGDGPLVEELVAQAVRALVYDPELPIRISVLTPNALDKRRKFYARHPALGPNGVASKDEVYGGLPPIAHIAFIESSLEQINVHALRAASTKQAIDAIYAVGRQDAEVRLMAAEAIKASDTLPKPPAVVACVRVGGGAPGEETELAGATFFELDHWLSGDRAQGKPALETSSHLDAFADKIAKRFFIRYEEKKNDRTYTLDEADELWRTAPHHIKWENRYSGDHALLKLKLLGLPEETPNERIKDAVKSASMTLQQLEHYRYIRERMTDGWILRLKGTKDNLYHLNPSLVPWHSNEPDGKPLEEGQREKDLAIVAELGAALDLLTELRTAIESGGRK